MQSVLNEGVNREELKEGTPVDALALFFNAELYGLMIAWCMTDAGVKGEELKRAGFQEKRFSFLSNFGQANLEMKMQLMRR